MKEELFWECSYEDGITKILSSTTDNYLLELYIDFGKEDYEGTLIVKEIGYDSILFQEEISFVYDEHEDIDNTMISWAEDVFATLKCTVTL